MTGSRGVDEGEGMCEEGFPGGGGFPRYRNWETKNTAP